MTHQNNFIYSTQSVIITKEKQMGTRNLTAVMLNGKYVVAQYGQWDGYPKGQGSTALEFCREKLQTEFGKEFFKDKLSLVRFVTDEEVKALLQTIGAPDGWLNMDQVQKFDVGMPYLSRNLGAKILQSILQSKEEEVLLRDSIAFAADSLFCEFAYVIDLDKNVFEAYKGFQKSPISPEERFANIVSDGGKNEEYYPIKMVGRWNLNSLPTLDELCKVYGSDEED